MFDTSARELESTGVVYATLPVGYAAVPYGRTPRTERTRSPVADATTQVEARHPRSASLRSPKNVAGGSFIPAAQRPKMNLTTPSLRRSNSAAAAHPRASAMRLGASAEKSGGGQSAERTRRAPSLNQRDKSVGSADKPWRLGRPHAEGARSLSSANLEPFIQIFTSERRRVSQSAGSGSPPATADPQSAAAVATTTPFQQTRLWDPSRDASPNASSSDRLLVTAQRLRQTIRVHQLLDLVFAYECELEQRSDPAGGYRNEVPSPSSANAPQLIAPPTSELLTLLDEAVGQLNTARRSLGMPPFISHMRRADTAAPYADNKTQLSVTSYLEDDAGNLKTTTLSRRDMGSPQPQPPSKPLSPYVPQGGTTSLNDDGPGRASTSGGNQTADAPPSSTSSSQYAADSHSQYAADVFAGSWTTGSTSVGGASSMMATTTRVEPTGSDDRLPVASPRVEASPASPHTLPAPRIIVLSAGPPRPAANSPSAAATAAADKRNQWSEALRSATTNASAAAAASIRHAPRPTPVSSSSRTALLQQQQQVSPSEVQQQQQHMAPSSEVAPHQESALPSPSRSTRIPLPAEASLEAVAAQGLHSDDTTDSEYKGAAAESVLSTPLEPHTTAEEEVSIRSPGSVYDLAAQASAARIRRGVQLFKSRRSVLESVSNALDESAAAAAGEYSAVVEKSVLVGVSEGQSAWLRREGKRAGTVATSTAAVSAGAAFTNAVALSLPSSRSTHVIGGGDRVVSAYATVTMRPAADADASPDPESMRASTGVALANKADAVASMGISQSLPAPWHAAMSTESSRGHTPRSGSSSSRTRSSRGEIKPMPHTDTTITAATSPGPRGRAYSSEHADTTTVGPRGRTDLSEQLRKQAGASSSSLLYLNTTATGVGNRGGVLLFSRGGQSASQTGAVAAATRMGCTTFPLGTVLAAAASSSAAAAAAKSFATPPGRRGSLGSTAPAPRLHAPWSSSPETRATEESENTEGGALFAQSEGGRCPKPRQPRRHWDPVNEGINSDP